MKYKIWEMRELGYPLLYNFLYKSIFVPDSVEPLSKRIITALELQVYVKDFGTTKVDFVLVTEVENKIIGAVWVRIMNDYGHINDKTPSLAISLYKNIEGKKLGAV